MSRIVDSRSVLAVRNLKESTEFFTEVLGFQRDPIEAGDWSFLTRDGCKVRLGECPDERPAGELGNHSSVLYLTVEGLDQLHQEIAARGAEVISDPVDEPWGMREFAIRTPDGHRIRFGEPIPVG